MSLNTTLIDDEKEETDCDKGDNTQINDIISFNLVVDLKDISMHVIENSVRDDESTYSDEKDEKVTFDELQDKYNLIYTMWIMIVEINKELKKDLQEV